MPAPSIGVVGSDLQTDGDRGMWLRWLAIHPPVFQHVVPLNQQAGGPGKGSKMSPKGFQKEHQKGQTYDSLLVPVRKHKGDTFEFL